MKQKIIDSIRQHITEEKEGIDLYNVIIEVVKKWNGKMINKRFCNDVNKLTEPMGYTFYYRTQYGMFHVESKSKYPERVLSFLIAYDNNPYVCLDENKELNHKGFTYHACCYGTAAIERNAQREKFLKNDKKLNELADNIMALNAIKKTIREKFFDYGKIAYEVRYSLKELIDNEEV
jgi:hypothetical protein